MITHISIATVFVKDIDASKAFYIDILGFAEHTDITLGEGYRWCTVKHPSQPELQVHLAQPGPPLSPDMVGAMQRALDGGCDSIEHGLDLDDAAIARMVKQGTSYCPTLSVYYYGLTQADTPRARRDRLRVALHKVSFEKAMKAGVRIVFGTDVGGFAWTEPIAQEFGRMVELGMSPMDTIRSATSRSAEMLGAQGELGVIAAGAYADLVAVAGDPLKDVKVLLHVGFVMKDGRVFKDELTKH